MSFIPNNPLTIPEVELPSSVPKPGTRGLIAMPDGWYDVDSDGNMKKIANEIDGDFQKLPQPRGTISDSDTIIKILNDGWYFVTSGATGLPIEDTHNWYLESITYKDRFQFMRIIHGKTRSEYTTLIDTKNIPTELSWTELATTDSALVYRKMFLGDLNTSTLQAGLYIVDKNSTNLPFAAPRENAYLTNYIFGKFAMRILMYESGKMYWSIYNNQENEKVLDWIDLNPFTNQDEKLVFMGDSIFGNDESENGIPARVAHYLQAREYYNCAFGGSTAAYRGSKSDDTKWNSFALYNLATAIVSKDFKLQDFYVTAPGISETFVAKLNRLKEIDFKTVDRLIVTIGSNDWGNNVAISLPKNHIEGTELYWTFNETTGVLTVGGKGSLNSSPWSSKLSEIKEVLVLDGVNSIGGSAFKDCTSLNRVTISNSVTSVGDSAFYGCTSLVQIKIPDSVTEIGDYTFSNCTALNSITFGKGVTSIGSYAFEKCIALKNITIPDTVTKMKDYVFLNCSATFGTITVPSSVEEIGSQIFDGCNVKYLKVYGYSNSPIHNYILNNKFKHTDGTSRNCTFVELNKTKIEGSDTYWEFNEGNKTLTISGTGNMDDWGVSDTDKAPWLENNVQTVTINDGITSIGNYAFYGCVNLTNVIIPESVTSIGAATFNGCTNKSFKINGYVQSYAQTYAKDNNILFVGLDTYEIVIKNTYIDALNYFVETMQTAFPELRIYLLPPPMKFILDENQYELDGITYKLIGDSDSHENSNGNTVKQFAEACMQCARDNHIPTIDIYNDVGVNKHNWKEFHELNDGSHFSSRGCERVGRFVASAIKGMQ